MTGALSDYCASGCPLSSELVPLPSVGLDLAPLQLTELDFAPLLFVVSDLEPILLEAAVLVVVGTAHHSVAD